MGSLEGGRRGRDTERRGNMGCELYNKTTSTYIFYNQFNIFFAVCFNLVL